MTIAVFTRDADPREVAEAIRVTGCAVLSRVVPDDLLPAVVAGFDELYPDWDELVTSRPDDLPALRADSDDLQAVGPFGIPALDAVPVLAPVRAVVNELLPSPLLLLSHLWAKYGQLAADYDLPLHSDFINHTMVYPSGDPKYQIIHAIAYYSDVTMDNGPTFAVPRQHTAEQDLLPLFHLRSVSPHLYEHEEPVLASSGSVLLYDTRLLHRVERMHDARARRRTHFFAYGPSGVPWLGWGRWLTAKPGLARQRFVEQLDAAGLASIGFPAPDSDYWTKETIAGTQLLYPGLTLPSHPVTR
jgi:hypothetical protein